MTEDEIKAIEEYMSRWQGNMEGIKTDMNKLITALRAERKATEKLAKQMAPMGKGGK